MVLWAIQRCAERERDREREREREREAVKSDREKQTGIVQLPTVAAAQPGHFKDCLHTHTHTQSTHFSPEILIRVRPILF